MGTMLILSASEHVLSKAVDLQQELVALWCISSPDLQLQTFFLTRLTNCRALQLPRAWTSKVLVASPRAEGNYVKICWWIDDLGHFTSNEQYPEIMRTKFSAKLRRCKGNGHTKAHEVSINT